MFIASKGRDAMLGYKAALDWLVANDDNDWVESRGYLSVTASLVADIYGKSDDKVRQDLEKRLASRK
jgi:hypothetical protein